MKRSDRLLPVRKLKEQKERAEAHKLAECQKQLQMAQRQALELQNYRAEYYQGVHQNRQGISSSYLDKSHQFISRLNIAIESQLQVVKNCEQALEKQKQVWADAHAKLKAMDDLIDRLRIEEQVQEDKQEQKMLDEYALRIKRDN